MSKRISGDVETKIKLHPFKIYFFGIEDKTKEIDPLPSNKFSSDRIGSLEDKISKELSTTASINLLKVPLDISNECLLMMFAIKDGQQ